MATNTKQASDNKAVKLTSNLRGLESPGAVARLISKSQYFVENKQPQPPSPCKKRLTDAHNFWWKRSDFATEWRLWRADWGNCERTQQMGLLLL